MGGIGSVFQPENCYRMDPDMPSSRSLTNVEGQRLMWDTSTVQEEIAGFPSTSSRTYSERSALADMTCLSIGERVMEDVGKATFDFELEKEKIEKELLNVKAQAHFQALAAQNEVEDMENRFQSVKSSNEELEKTVWQLRFVVTGYVSQLNGAREELRVLNERYYDLHARYANLEAKRKMDLQELNSAKNATEHTLLEELNQMRFRSKMLSDVVQDLEKQRGELVSSDGFFDSSSGATSSQLQKLANKLRDLLSSLSKKLMISMRKALKESNRAVEELESNLVQGVNFSNKPDVKFAYQKLVADICFQGFESEDYGILDSLPATLDRDQNQAEYINQFKTLNSLSVAQVYDKVKKIESTMQACGSKACLDAGYCCCGVKSFLQFVVSKERNLRYELGQILKMRGAPDHGFWNATIQNDLVQFLKSVWLAHRLSFAFEPPATLFKIRSGHDFDLQYMVNVGMTREQGVEDGQQVHKVSFMIIPGFRVAKSVIRGLVYVP